MDIYKNNKIALSLFTAITIIAIGGVYTYISSNHPWNQQKVAEAVSITNATKIGTCKNTYTRNNNNCGTGCGNYSGGDTTQLWRSYDVYKNITQTTKNPPYTFVSLTNVYSTGDKWNESNNTTLLAGKCDGNFGGAYAICCSGSTPKSATKLDPNNPYSDPYPPSEAGCGSYSKIISTPLACPSVPTATLSANPTSITKGKSSTLTWNSTNATGCTGTNFGTSNNKSGTYSVSPTSTTNYSVTCAGSGGTSNPATATVTVTAPTLSSSPTNGSCGSANGVPTNSAPSTSLCSAGTASTVSGTGPWAWTCNGSNGGTTASCSAPKQQPINNNVPASNVDIKVQ